MKKGLAMVFFVLIMVFAQAQEYDTLRTLFNSSVTLNKHFYGFSLYDMDHNQFVFGVNDDKHFTPASNTKIFALLTALKNLGDSIPGLAYVVRGDSLLFWGTGDPTFLHKKLDSHRIYDFLASTPLELYYVVQPATESFFRPGWSMEDYNYYYQPEIATFPIYGNVVNFRSSAGKIRASPVYFERFLKTTNRSKTFYISRRFEDNMFMLSSSRIPKSFATEKPFKYSDDLFLSLLQDTLRRQVEMITYDMPSDIQFLYSNSTKDVVREMMVHSDNFFAEQLNYLCSFVKYQYFDSNLVREDMKEQFYRVFVDSIDLHDESGLSVYNKVTPRSMVEALLMVKMHIPDEPARFDLFAVGGVSGTLKGTYPLHINNGIPYVWAKTGTISGVHCQSGYVITKTGKRYTFSFLNNNFRGGARPVRNEMVKIITYIHENY